LLLVVVALVEQVMAQLGKTVLILIQAVVL
jgi:hypothetical protein